MGQSNGSNGDAYMVANAAMEAIEHHMEDCKEFRRDLKTSQIKAESDREKLRDMISERFSDLYGFLWKITFSLVGLLVIVVLALIAFIANNSFVFKTP